MTSPAALRRPGILWTLLAGALVLIPLLLVLRYGTLYLLFIPAALLVPPLLGRRILAHPVSVLWIFLLVIVNLDFFRLGGRVTLDILVSSVLLWALLVRLGLGGRFLWQSAVEKGFLFYLAMTLISVLVSVSPGASAKNWARDLEYFVVVSFFLGYALTGGERRALTAAVLISSIVPCVAGFVGMALDIPSLYGLPTPTGDGGWVRRLYGTLSHPVVFSHYLGLMCTLTFGLLLDRRWFQRRYLLPLFALQVGALYFTYGRTGWIEFMIGVAVILWMRGRRAILLLSVPALVWGLVQFVPSFTQRWQTAFTQSHENSFLFRLSLWAYALTLVPNRPLFGSGQDTFIQYVDFQTGYAAHQTWMGLLVETGILGLLSFVVLLVAVGRALAARRRERGDSDPLLIPVVAAWAGQLVGSLAGDPFGLPAVAVYLWCLLGMVLGPRAEDRTEATPASG